MEILLGLMPHLRTRFGVKELGVFGSYVRGEQKPDSDIDLLVDFERNVSLWDLMELEGYLSEMLGLRVDLVKKDALKNRPKVEENILKSYVPVVENWRSLLEAKDMPKGRDFRAYMEDILK